MFINENNSEKSEKKGAQPLFPALQGMKNLTPLDSSEDNPEKKGEEVLFLDLKEVMESFILRGLNGNNYEKEGAQALVTGLQEMKNLTPLFSSMNYEKEGAQKLAKVLENKSTKVDDADVTKHTSKKQQSI